MLGLQPLISLLAEFDLMCLQNAVVVRATATCSVNRHDGVCCLHAAVGSVFLIRALAILLFSWLE